MFSTGKDRNAMFAAVGWAAILMSLILLVGCVAVTSPNTPFPPPDAEQGSAAAYSPGPSSTPSPSEERNEQAVSPSTGMGEQLHQPALPAATPLAIPTPTLTTRPPTKTPLPTPTVMPATRRATSQPPPSQPSVQGVLGESAPASSTAAAPAEGSLLQRQDTPPEGVAEQFGAALLLSPYFIPPSLPQTPSCDPHTEPGVFPQGTDEPISIGDSLTICLAGFAPNQNAECQVTWPDGTIEMGSVNIGEDGTGHFGWWSLPGEPFGTYTVFAVQGSLTAGGVFNVQAAPAPQIRVHPRTGPAGSEFGVVLAGFPANGEVRIHLYKRRGVSLWFYGTSLSLHTDHRGEALYPLPTRPDDPPGTYLLTTGVPRESAAFTVTAASTQD